MATDCQSQIVGNTAFCDAFCYRRGKRGDFASYACALAGEAAVLNAWGCDGDESGKWVRGGAGGEREEPAASQMNMKYPFRYKCVCVVL